MTATVSKFLAAIKTQANDQYGAEMHDLIAFEATLRTCDEKLSEEIHAISVEHETRRERIQEQLVALAARLGRLPKAQRLDDDAVSAMLPEPASDPLPIVLTKEQDRRREMLANIDRSLPDDIIDRGLPQ